MRITSLGGNVKPGPGRPNQIDVGQITVLAGPHGAGKTRLDQMLQFALKGSVRDLAFRPGQEMREGGTLLGLTQAAEDSLTAWVCFDDGTRVERVMPIRHDRAGNPSAGRVPDVALPSGMVAEKVLPIPGIQAALCRRPAEVRALYLPYILSLPAEQQEVLIADRLRTVEEDLALLEEKEIPKGAEALGRLVRRASSELEDLEDRMKGARDLLQRVGQSIAEPQPLRALYARAVAGALRSLHAFRAARTLLTRSEEAHANACTNIDKLQADPGPAPAGPQAKNPFLERVKPQYELLMEIAQQQRTTCPLCESSLTVVHMSTVYARTAQASETIETYNASVTVAPELLVAWNAQRARRDALQAEVTRLEAHILVEKERVATALAAVGPALQALSDCLPTTSPGQWGEDPVAVLNTAQAAPEAQLLELLHRYEGIILSEDTASTQWDQFKRARAVVDEDEGKIQRLRRIKAAGQEAEKALLAASLSSFRGRMQRWMPLGWEALLRIEDERGSDVFRLAVRVNGVTCYEPSGVQSLVLLYAFALALDAARSETPCMVLTPSTECHISKDVLPLLIDVYKDLPAHVQVFLHTVEEPSAKIAKIPGVVVHRLAPAKG